MQHFFSPTTLAVLSAPPRSPPPRAARGCACGVRIIVLAVILVAALGVFEVVGRLDSRVGPWWRPKGSIPGDAFRGSRASAKLVRLPSWQVRHARVCVSLYLATGSDELHLYHTDFKLKPGALLPLRAVRSGPGGKRGARRSPLAKLSNQALLRGCICDALAARRGRGGRCNATRS